jgi:hypothetical protein
MAHTEKLVHAPVEAVFAVLSDPRTYERFVVGSKRVRHFDPDWPDVDAAFHHTVGIGPLALRDKTVVHQCEPPTRLVVWPYIRPFVVTETVFALEPRGDDTLLRLDEYAVEGPLSHVWAGPLDGLMGLRNIVVARRLAELAEQHHGQVHGVMSAVPCRAPAPDRPH